MKNYILLMLFMAIFLTADNCYSQQAGNVGTAVAADKSGNCYVTGYTSAFSSNFDYITVKYDKNGDTLWTAIYNGESNDDDKAFGIAVDQDGNVYVTGYSYSSRNGYDYLTVKYNSTGVQQWTARYDGTGNSEDKAFGIATDQDGNIYVTGKSKGSNLSFDYVTIKYSPDGTMQWCDRYDGPSGDDDEADAITIDKRGNICVTGFSKDNSTGYDYATIRYSSSGTRQWVARYTGSGNNEDKAFGIATDADCNVFVTGYSTSDNGPDYLTVKYDSSGNQLWTANYNGPGNAEDKAFGIATDADGNVYITGESKGINTDFDYATVKYNSSGVQQWAARYNGEGNNVDVANAMIMAGSSVFVTGKSVGTSTASNMVTIKYDASTGTQLGLTSFSSGSNYSDVALAIATDTSSDVYITGYSFEIIGGSRHPAHMTTLRYNRGSFGIIHTGNGNIPSAYKLSQNYPNPFNPVTTIKFEIPLNNGGFVQLKIYDILGREAAILVNQQLTPGRYEIKFDGTNYSSGVYFYKLTAGSFVQTKQMVLVK
jgi:uncharacterized delta-60 repeat protein